MLFRAFFRFFLFSLALNCFHTRALAEIQIISITGYSAIENFPVSSTVAGTTSSTIEVLAGTAGPTGAGTEDCANPSTESTCNNCVDTDDDNQVCNTNRVHPGLNFRIRFRSTGSTGKAGKPIITKTDKSERVAGFNTSIASNVILPIGQIVEININWGSICDQLGAGALCDKDVSSKLLYFGVSSDGNILSSSNDDSVGINFQVLKTISQNGELMSNAAECSQGLADGNLGGPCEFSIVAGDSRVVISAFDAPVGFPVVNYTNTPSLPPKSFTKVRVLCKPAPVSYNGNENEASLIERFKEANIDPRNSVCADLDIEDDGTTLTPDSITDFENGVTYFFRLAAVDAAGNVGSYTKYENSAKCAVEDGVPASIFCHVATPGEILGVLANNQNCFIATAAFGSAFQPKVKALRLFRDRFLIVTDWGKTFVNFYYSISPKVAGWISHRPWARQITRVILYPVWAFAVLSLQYGVTLVLSALLFCFFLIMIVIKLNHKRRFKIARFTDQI